MAAILELVLASKVSTASVVNWLSKKTEVEDTPEVLQDLTIVRTEFVPFFLNYLRDQSLNILQSSKSAAASPAKTPTSSICVKTKKQENAVPVSSSVSTPCSANRVQLFASSPFDSGGISRLSPPVLTTPNVSFDSPRVSGSHGRNTGSNKKYGNQRWSPSVEESTPKHGHSKGGSPFYGTPDHPRSKQRHCLGEYLFTPDGDQRKKKSPHSGRRDEHSPSPHLNRRSAGKNKNQQSGSDKRNRQQKQPLGSTKPPIFSLNNMEDFPPMGATSKPASEKKTPVMKEVTPSRRITPTPINQPGLMPNNAVFSSASTMLTTPRNTTVNQAFSVPLQESASSLDDERKFLREQKAKQMEESNLMTTPSKKGNRVELGSLLHITPTKPGGLDRMSSMAETQKADRSEVTWEDKLQILAHLYSGCIEEHLVPNLTVELYFLVQLLTVRGVETEKVTDILPDLDEINYFCSIHNAVYFAVTVLEKQTRVLSLLDKATVRLLVDNPRVADFSGSLKEYFSSLLQQSLATSRPSVCPSPIGGVNFQADTDNRKNFPNDKTFHTFKRQRDTFYELVREWENNHMTSGWSMADAIGDKIRSLTSYKMELANHIHFSRLFGSQLIQMCKGDSFVELDGEEANVALLCELKQTNPEKWKRLKERLITPSIQGGPCPNPSFLGWQEFFHDFITIALSPVFNQHITNSLAAKLHELNDLQVSLPEADGKEDIVIDQEDRSILYDSMTTLRLLGKFLGFLTFLPYQSLERLPDTMHAAYISMRNQVALPLDILGYLKAAQQSGRMVITVPWAVEFLSMMDCAAPDLDYLRQVFQVLLATYRYTSQQFHTRHGNYAKLLMIMTLGWLFELQVFPEGLFFQDVQSEALVCAPTTPVNCLDEAELADNRLLYSCCPYLGRYGPLSHHISPSETRQSGEIRSLLMNYAVGNNNKSSNIRKITPITTQVEVAPSLSIRQLQLQLEENFFNNHPASLKRTVEFVADRIASNHIKLFRAQVLLDMRNEATKTAKSLARAATSGSPDRKAKDKVSQQLQHKSVEIAQEARNRSAQTANRYCEDKANAILTTMLPEEMLEAIIKMAAQITCRQAMQKISGWMSAHITTGMFQREMKVEFDKHVKSAAQRIEKLRMSDSSQKPVGLADEEEAANAEKSQVAGVVHGQKTDCTPQTEVTVSSHSATHQHHPTVSDNAIKGRASLSCSAMEQQSVPVSDKTTDVTLLSPAVNDQCSLTASNSIKEATVSPCTAVDQHPRGTCTSVSRSLIVPLVASVAGDAQSHAPSSSSITASTDSIMPLTVTTVTSRCTANTSASGIAATPCVDNDIKTTTSTNVATQEDEHDERAASPSDILIEFKEQLQELVLGNKEPSPAVICDKLSQAAYTINHRQDTTAPIAKCLATMTTDLAIILVMTHPQIWSSDIQRHLVNLWKCELQGMTSFKNILCLKHVYQLERSPNSQLSWQKLQELLTCLLRESLLTAPPVEANCLKVLQYSLSESSLEHLALCICGVAKDFHSQVSTRQGCEFTEVLDWLFQLCAGLGDLAQYISSCLQFIQQQSLSNKKATSVGTEDGSIDEKKYCDTEQSGHNRQSTDYSKKDTGMFLKQNDTDMTCKQKNTDISTEQKDTDTCTSSKDNSPEKPVHITATTDKTETEGESGTFCDSSLVEQREQGHHESVVMTDSDNCNKNTDQSPADVSAKTGSAEEEQGSDGNNNASSPAERSMHKV